MLHRWQARRDDDAGFTLIEVVVAMTLFAILLSTVAVALGSTLKTVRNNQNRTVAANIATRVIDRLHAIPAARLPTTPLAPQTFIADGATFTVRSSVAAVTETTSATASACDGGGALRAKSVHVEVTWSGMGSTKPVVNDTLRRLTVSELDLTKGSLSVRVVDRDGVGVQGRELRLTPGSTLPATTGPDGCAVFNGVPAGSYAVSLTSLAGFVDPLGEPAPSNTVTIVGGNLTRDAGFRSDRSTAITARWVGPLLSTHPVISSTGVTVSNPVFTGGVRSYPVCGSTPCAVGAPTALAATGATVTGLFPFADGVRAWAGECADSTPFTTPPSVVLAPGATRTVDVQVAPVVVAVFDNDGNPRNRQDVQVTHVADTGCVASSRTVRAPSGSNQAAFSLPAGTWSFRSGGGAAVTRTIGTDGSVTAVTVRQA